MICVVCQGAGNILTTKRGLEWRHCPGCYHAGALVMHQPTTFRKARVPQRMEGVDHG